MLLNIGFVLLGFVALFYGADWLVKGSVRIANSLGIPPLVIGLTLVAFGTSTPEFLVTLTAAFRGGENIALGNVIGSNIANIGLILGLVGTIIPIFVNSQVLRREIPQLLIISLLVYAFAWDGQINRWEGLTLVLGLIAFTAYSYYVARQINPEEAEVAAEMEEFIAIEAGSGPQINMPLEIGRAIVGILILMVGAQLLVEGASSIARAFGISDLVIGLTLVAVGTSLPELATSLVSAMRKEDDISVGNIVGSNIFNLLGVLGGAAAISPVSIAPIAISVDFPIMILFSLIIIPLFWNGKLARWQGVLLLLGYVGYCGYLFTR